MSGTGAQARVLFVFVDGLGLGDADPAVNPVAAAQMPRITELLGGRKLTRDVAPWYSARAALVAMDATMGVPGLPQSGTGHVALLTGANAARMFGRHFGPWPPTALRSLLAEKSILARARAAGCRVAFANAYPEEVVRALRSRFGTAATMVAGAAVDRPTGGSAAGIVRPRYPLPRAGPPLAALAAGLLVRHAAELARGEAVASEIANDAWRDRLGRRDVPAITPAHAGENLARIAAAHDLTLFAHYHLDHLGHRGTHSQAVAALERLDQFIGAVLDRLPDDVLLFLGADHGNLEDTRAGHTHNPAVGLVAGAGADTFAAGLDSLLEVAPALLERLGVA